MPKPEKAPLTETRIDKWLWAARFYKTRSLAAAAVPGGKVRISGGRAIASRLVRQGEQLLSARGDLAFDVLIVDMSGNRGRAC